MRNRDFDHSSANDVTENVAVLPSRGDLTDLSQLEPPQRRSADDEQTRHVVAVGRHFALRRHVPIDHVDDCSLDFYLLYLKSVRQAGRSSPDTPLSSRPCSTQPDAIAPLQPICRMADNHAHNFERRERQLRELHAVSLADDSEANRRLLETLADPAPDPHALALRAEIRKAIDSALDMLPAIDHDIFMLHYVHHHTLCELANRFGMTYPAIKSRLGAIRKRLQAHLEAASSG